MSWRCEVKSIKALRPIPDADAIELAVVGNDWPVVVRKGSYQAGQKVCYFPADSIIPDKYLAEWGLTGKLGRSGKNVVCPVRLRKQLSIGIICPLPDGEPWEDGHNVESYFGVTRYEAPIPIALAGKMKSRPSNFVTYDVENINNNNPFIDGEEVVVHHKIHGTSASFVIVDGVFNVNSRNCCLQFEEANTYWRAAIKYRIEDILKTVPQGTYIHGEIYGPVQDLKYGSPNDIQFAVFDIRDEKGYWDADRTTEFCNRYGLPMVPLVYRGPYSTSKMLELAQLPEQVSGKALHVGEGIVVKPVKERTDDNGERAIRKFINPDYLTRKNGTEYH